MLRRRGGDIAVVQFNVRLLELPQYVSANWSKIDVLSGRCRQETKHLVCRICKPGLLREIIMSSSDGEAVRSIPMDTRPQGA